MVFVQTCKCSLTSALPEIYWEKIIIPIINWTLYHYVLSICSKSFDTVAYSQLTISVYISTYLSIYTIYLFISLHIYLFYEVFHKEKEK